MAATFLFYKPIMRRILLYLLPLFLLSCGINGPSVDPEPKDTLNRVALVADTLTNFPNPERGFHHFCEFKSPRLGTLSTTEMQSYREEGISLVVTIYYLPDCRTMAIPDSYLDVVRTNMEILRQTGMKCILRFAYTDNEYSEPHEAPVDTVLNHIHQLKPILQEYGDVIFTMEAGFVGAWGEWYYTTYFKSSPVTNDDFKDRRRVLDALLDALPVDRQVCVRTPSFKLRCYGWSIADTITRATAYDGSPKSRLAAHDDAFMSDNSDMGTFTSTALRKYWEADTRYTIYGGESDKPGSYANADSSMVQMRNMHISYLNIDYHRGVISGWEQEGKLDLFRRLIGYRLVAENVGYSTPVANQPFRLEVVLTNQGFSSPKNPRDVKMLLINEQSGEEYTNNVNEDPRFWFTDEHHAVGTCFSVPAGTYKVVLYLPDPKPNLAADPRYAIRLANENVWDEETGYNYLTTITVE